MQNDIELGTPIVSHTAESHPAEPYQAESHSMEQQPAGYPQWSSCIASDPDSETFVFRKFNELAALNLLCLQSEILELESQLKQLNRNATRSQDMSQLDATRHWETLVAQSQEPQTHPESDERMKLILKLRSRIKEYREPFVLKTHVMSIEANTCLKDEALLRQSKIAQLQAPNKRILGALRQMFIQDGYQKLEGKAREYLDKKTEMDLIALKSPTEDALSNYLRRTWAVKVNHMNTLKKPV